MSKKTASEQGEEFKKGFDEGVKEERGHTLSHLESLVEEHRAANNNMAVVVLLAAIDGLSHSKVSLNSISDK
jgi:tellurite resistance protein